MKRKINKIETRRIETMGYEILSDHFKYIQCVHYEHYYCTVLGAVMGLLHKKLKKKVAVQI